MITKYLGKTVILMNTMTTEARIQGAASMTGVNDDDCQLSVVLILMTRSLGAPPGPDF